MRTTPRWVTPSDFNNYIGKDLNYLLQVGSSSSNTANSFLLHVEDALMARIDKISFRKIRWEDINDGQKDSLQKAILWQAEYILRNSDLFTDSGYNPESGLVIEPEKLASIQICQTSMDLLNNCGLLNHVISNRHRYNDYFGIK